MHSQWILKTFMQYLFYAINYHPVNIYFVKQGQLSPLIPKPELYFPEEVTVGLSLGGQIYIVKADI